MGPVEIALSMIMGGNGGGGGGGGSSAPEKDVNFIDYDGTIVDSYTAEEFAALSAMPANPTHEGLTSQGWNWSLANAKTHVAAYGKLNVGQMYVTTSGDTEIDIKIHAPRLTPYLGIAVNGTVDVDWGDGSTHETVTGTSLTTQVRTPHTYAAEGQYTIKIHANSGSYELYGSSTYSVISGGFATANNNRVYATALKAARIGSGVSSIGAYAFYNCSSLSSVTIPNNVSSIGSNAFNNCAYLSSVTIPSGITGIGDSRFQACQAIHSLSIPNSVTSFGNSVFYGCYDLPSITIPSGVTSFGSSAFYNCHSLVSITIPSGVTSISSSLLGNCYGLGSITFLRTTPPSASNSNWYANLPTDCIIYVPYSADHSVLAAYKAETNYPDPSSYTYQEASA